MSLQVEKLKSEDCTDSIEDNINSAILKCVVSVEIKGCDFICYGTGYGGDYGVLQQGQYCCHFESLKKKSYMESNCCFSLDITVAIQ